MTNDFWPWLRIWFWPIFDYFHNLNLESSFHISHMHLLNMKLIHFSSFINLLHNLICSIPLYLAVNMKYGPEVAKELTPLWICGPLLVALYIKIVQGLCLLYVYSFKQSVKLVKNLPVYYDYVISGKLKETIHARLWQPVVDFRNLGYKGIWKQVQEWVIDKYLDYIESIWPHYCKLIRFLKRANFI